jgi:hypothetical protein
VFLEEGVRGFEKSDAWGAAMHRQQCLVNRALLSSGKYIVNDVRDAHEDRGHPRKRLRPDSGPSGYSAPASSSALRFSAAVSKCFLVRRITTGSASLKKPRLSPR